MVRKTHCGNVCRSCLERRFTKPTVLSRPHTTNGCGNRFSGIRGAYEISKRMNMDFSIDWPEHETESDYFHTAHRTVNKNIGYHYLNASSCPVTFYDTSLGMNNKVLQVVKQVKGDIIFEQISHDFNLNGIAANDAYNLLFTPHKSFLKDFKSYIAGMKLDTNMGWLGL